MNASGTNLIALILIRALLDIHVYYLCLMTADEGKVAQGSTMLSWELADVTDI